jgi:light-regulated signal transduction histidine kinase (bacteriophytochrome)
MRLFQKMIDMDERDKKKSLTSASSSLPGNNNKSSELHSSLVNGLKSSVSNEEALKVLVERLTEQNQQLEQQIADLKFEFDQFTHNLTRSIRVPFRSIVALTEGLIKNCSRNLGPYGQSYCENIVYSVDNIEKILIDLFQYHRLGTAEIDKTEFDLETLINQILTDYRNVIEFQNAKIIVDNKLAKVYSCRPILYQIFYHLILYNLDNTEKNVRPGMHIYSQDNQNENKLFISSNGKPFSNLIIELLNSEDGEFGFFEQGEQSGIGLSIVRKGCNLLNVKFGAKVIQGEGNLFWIQFNPYNIVVDKKE